MVKSCLNSSTTDDSNIFILRPFFNLHFVSTQVGGGLEISGVGVCGTVIKSLRRTVVPWAMAFSTDNDKAFTCACEIAHKIMLNL